MRVVVVFLVWMMSHLLQAQTKFSTTEVAINDLISGTLYQPVEVKKPNLVILIAGSGPTDRDGNQPGGINNSLKFLAQGLAGNAQAVFSYDKRIFGLYKKGELNEQAMRFSDMVTDAVAVVNHFKKTKKFGKIFIAGHSEGSLVGILASQQSKVDGFISIAGLASKASEAIKRQIAQNSPSLSTEANSIFDQLEQGNLVTDVPAALQNVFRESVQPYLISWIKYNPQDEIQKLKIPILILNGTNDLQVPQEEAIMLAEVKPEAKVVIIAEMNHVLKPITGSVMENIKSYSDPDQPISEDLISAIVDFVK